MTKELDIIKVAANTAGKILVHAQGNPAQIVAVGLAAGIVFVGTGIGYGIYKGGDRVLGWVKANLAD